MNTKYCLVSDDSGHDYVIPASRYEEWYELTEDDDVDVPDWAVHVEGGLVFENPSVDGELLFPKRLEIVIIYQIGGYDSIGFDWNKVDEPTHHEVMTILKERNVPFNDCWDMYNIQEI